MTPAFTRYDYRELTALQIANLFNICQTAYEGNLVYKTTGTRTKIDVAYIRHTEMQVNQQAWKQAERQEYIDRRIDHKDLVCTDKGKEFLEVFAILDFKKRPRFLPPSMRYSPVSPGA